MSQQTRTDAGLAVVLRVSVGRLARRLRGQRLDEALSLSQSAVLFTLDRHGAMTPGALADHEKVQPPSMTRVIAALQERELVRRTKHPQDGRQHLVELTGQGAEWVKTDRRTREAWLSKRLAELTPEEKAVLRKAAGILEKLSQS